MKKLIYNISAILIALALLAGCDQFKDVSGLAEIKGLSATVSLNLTLGSAPSPDDLTVRLINYEERFEVSASIDPSGSTKIDNLIPGIYTITVSGEKNKDGFTYNYSGNLVNVDIVKDNKSLVVDLGASKSGALVMKEIYYCGSRTLTGGVYFRDQFYEIYNNSEVPQNVKGLAIAILNPMTATANLPVWPGDDAADYVYGSTIWQVPEDRDYIINPGESIIIAQMADNHQKENLNPNSPVNLLGAEFETFVRSSSLISDNPAINMTMAFWPRPTPQWLTTVFGGAFVIWIPAEPIDPTNTVSPVGRTDQNYRIPIAEVIDAVELVGNANQVQLKRMPAVLDAGAMTVGGTYLSKSVARKIKETKSNGRIVYMDTNNSSDDFEVMDTPQIRRNGANAPAWNTWK